MWTYKCKSSVYSALHSTRCCSACRFSFEMAYNAAQYQINWSHSDIKLSAVTHWTWDKCHSLLGFPPATGSSWSVYLLSAFKFRLVSVSERNLLWKRATTHQLIWILANIYNGLAPVRARAHTHTHTTVLGSYALVHKVNSWWWDVIWYMYAALCDVCNVMRAKEEKHPHSSVLWI